HRPVDRGSEPWWRSGCRGGALLSRVGRGPPFLDPAVPGFFPSTELTRSFGSSGPSARTIAPLQRRPIVTLRWDLRTTTAQHGTTAVREAPGEARSPVGHAATSMRREREGSRSRARG